MAGKKGMNLGNNNASVGKIFRDAMHKAIVQDAAGKKRLHKAFEKVLDKSAEGDIAALQFLADRSIGKAPQAIALTGEDGGPIRVAEVRWEGE